MSYMNVHAHECANALTHAYSGRHNIIDECSNQFCN